MSVIMTRCCETGSEISTGISTDVESFNRLPDVEARLTCPFCGKEHVWAKSNSWLDGTVKQADLKIEISSA
jgi:hypothetical protein